MNRRPKTHAVVGILALAAVSACRRGDPPAAGELAASATTAGTTTPAVSEAQATVSRACGDAYVANRRILRERLGAADADSAREVVAATYAEALGNGPSEDAIGALQCVIKLGDDTAYHRALLAALTMSVEARGRAATLDDQAGHDRAELARIEGEAAALRAQIAADLEDVYLVEGIMEAELAAGEYEISPFGSPTRAILKTTATAFTTPGRFSLRVRDVGSRQVKLRPELGGFTQEWKILEEVVDDLDARQRLARLENDVALYRRRVEESGSALVPGQSIEQRAAAWFSRLRSLASPLALPTSAEVVAQRLDADTAALTPPPGLVESFLAQPLEDLMSCCNEAPFSGTGDSFAPDWGTAMADVQLLGAVAPSLIEEAITRDGNPGVAAALVGALPLAERFGPALRAAQASSDAEMKLQAARTLALTGLADERTADALLDVIGLAATPDSEQSVYAYYFAVTALEALRATKAPTEAQVARLRGFRAFVSSNANIESVWTDTLRGWEAGGGFAGTRSTTP